MHESKLTARAVQAAIVLALLLPFSAASGAHKQKRPAVQICVPSKAAFCEKFAARELRRLFYLAFGSVPEITNSPPQDRPAFVLGSKGATGLLPASLQQSAEALPPQAFLLKKEETPSGFVFYVVGGDPLGTLYGVYRLAEHFGLRFYLHGEAAPPMRSEPEPPEVNERSEPLFALRGIQPFHDFPEGPDWWNTDDYLAVLAQLPKLRMNFIGLHTYPEGRPEAEPTVWIGAPSDTGGGLEVEFAYPASYQNTLRGNWGYRAKPTSRYLFGASLLFDRDAYGSEVMEGLCPRPRTPAQCREVFRRTGALLRRVFEAARRLGVQTCVGTETPLVIPKAVKERLRSQGKNPSDPAVVKEIYEGIFRRIAAAHPLDWYWFWTPEGWTWSGVKKENVEKTIEDLKLALEAHRACGAPFRLATCGWVLGPQYDRALFDKVLPPAVALSCINRQVGNEPVDPAFGRVKRKDKWAIPWLEDDPGLTAPQLWVGRMRQDAADALRYGCSGLMGIHWRTRVLGPNVLALAWAAWEQEGWRHLRAEKEKLQEGPLGGQTAAFPGHRIEGTDLGELYRTVRYNMDGYLLAVPNGIYKVTLRFCEPHWRAPGKRVFGVKIQGRTVIPRLDVFARVGADRALDFTFEARVTDGRLKIDFVRIVEFPCIAAIDVIGPVERRINCGGPAWRNWRADWPASATVPRGEPCGDFYLDWAAHQFGPRAGRRIAEIFEALDGRLPRPATWVGGPGGIRPDKRPWSEVGKQYEFVRSLDSLRPLVQGAAYLARFDYWLNTFFYMREMARVRCTWHALLQALAAAEKQPTKEAKEKAARTKALPLRVELVRQTARVYRYLLSVVSTPGELGTVANWEQHIIPELLEATGKRLEKLLGGVLPPEALPAGNYTGPPRLIVPTVRTAVEEGESITLRVLILSLQKPVTATLNWRPGYGSGRFKTVPLLHVARGVYTVTFPPGGVPAEGLQYYVEASFPAGPVLRFPPTAPDPAQTVAAWPKP